MADVEIDMLDIVLGELSRYRARDDVPRRQLGSGIVARHETATIRQQ